ncbi:MAG: hypothetical protein ACTSWZ_00715 [Candidatus Heimdallarchaeaceae archaeon]
MAKRKIGRVRKADIVAYGRDIAGMITSGLLTASLREVGALISFWLSPKIAKTSGGKEFNKYLSLLLLADSLAERLMGGKGVM